MTQERWLMALGGVALVLIVGGGLALALGGGDDDASIETQPASTTTTALVTTTVPTTLAPVTVATQGPVTPQTIGAVCTTPDEASQALANAWFAGDQAAAGRCASQGAVSTLFQTSGAGASWTYQGCFGDDPGVPQCAYTYPGGSAHFTLNGTEAQGWKVVSVGYVAD